MVNQSIRLGALLCGWLLGACGDERDDAPARVIIDMRCSSAADCPTGFRCESDAEHGPPTTMCESTDATIACPPSYETRVGYGHTFCKPRDGVVSCSGSDPVPAMARGPRSARAGSGRRPGL